jgi:hypothetical protein
VWTYTDTNQRVCVYNTTTAALTFIAVPSTRLAGICTDGTYVYVCDGNANTPPYTSIYRIDMAFTVTVFYSVGFSNDGFDLFFDGTHIWHTNWNAGKFFYELDLTGAVVNTYGGPGDFGGGIVNDGTYWFVGGTGIAAAGGIWRATVGAPGTWANAGLPPGLTGDGCLIEKVAGGKLWITDFGSTLSTVWSMDPATEAFTSYTIGIVNAPIFYYDFDGTDLWFSSDLGIWQTTPAAPAVGTDYPSAGSVTLSVRAIRYDPATTTIFAEGLQGSNNFYVFGQKLAGGNPMRLLV